MSAVNIVGTSHGRVVAGRYRLDRRLGEGAEGETFAATDLRAETQVALKLFATASPSVAKRVRHEFERLACMAHPSVVRVLDAGREGERAFLVTEIIDGEDLGAITETSDEQQRRTRFLRLAVELTDALAYLHGRGVVHGDVSPENVRLSSSGRAVLMDLGAAAVASTGGASGTLGFAAPEALIGAVQPSCDLFSLGATLFFAWTGQAPFGRGMEAVQRTLGGLVPRLSEVRAGLPTGWDELIRDLLRATPDLRPSSARQVLLRLARLEPNRDVASPELGAELLPPFPAGDALAGVFVGRTDERRAIASALLALGEGSARHTVVALVGAEGAGRRALIELALQELAIQELGATQPPVLVFRGGLPALVAWLSPSGLATSTADAARTEDEQGDSDPERRIHRRFTRLARDLETRAAKTPLCVAFPPGPDEAAFATFLAGATPVGRLLVLLPVTQSIGRVGAMDLNLAPLNAEEVGALVARAVGEPVSPAIAGRIFEASGGHAATAAHLVRQLVTAFREGAGERFVPKADTGLAELLSSSWAGLSPYAQRFLAGVALGLPTETTLEGAALAAADEARAAGWLTGELTNPRLPGAAHQGRVLAALREPALQDLAVAALADETKGGLAPADGRRGLCFLALGRTPDAVLAFQAAALAAPEGLGETSACRWLERAFDLTPSALTLTERIRLANQLALEGRGAEASRVLNAKGGETPPSAKEVLALSERRAWLSARGGDLAGARAILEQALAAPDASDAATAPCRARLARVLVGLNRFADALAVARLALTDPVAGPLAIESSLLAHAYAGDLALARAFLAALPSTALPPARARFLAALVAQLAGDVAPALLGYQDVLGKADQAGDVHTAAAAALNLGALAAEAGNYGLALASGDRAIRDLGRMGATAELGAALFNAGMLLVELGDLPGAGRMVARLRSEIAHRAGTSEAKAAYLDAEIAGRRGDRGAELRGAAPRSADLHSAELRAAIDGFARVASSASADRALSVAARLAQVDLLARLARSEEALALLAELEHAMPTGGSDLRLSHARVSLASTVGDVDAALSLAVELVKDGEQAAASGRRPRAWRAGLVAARLFERLGRPDSARTAFSVARSLFEEIRMSTPIDHRPGLDQDPDARFFTQMAGLGGTGADAAAVARATASEGRLRRLLRINKRLNSELRLPRLLELILDTVIELTEAERGFVLLEDDKGELCVKAARNIDQQSLEDGAFDLSRSIARQAATGGAPIVTIDAAGDPRFREALSVSDLHLRSVLAVPLSIKGRAVGTVYVDNRLRKGAFGDEDVQLAMDFSEQAAIAIENARLLAELRRRERQIETLNRRLEGELAARKEELTGMKQELRENREALAIRYDYRNIVGRTPRMMELFRLLDRLTDTALPVVIQGESGTGKELVARALHFNGPRRQQPFVSENCAAIPETLLESTLFGAVRGAFTGADHDSRGLFEVADGGTLFLDEVGEMSPGMQGKLLRILQTGELRRVGAERTRKVDVRIIAATNRDLGRMVEEGRFRQDLFFRLSVARILLPPLRERREDIPLITEHLLAKLAAKSVPKTSGQKAPPRVEPTAMARLCAYRWPGNIRELENEIMRALAMCASESIAVTDLSPHVAGDAEAALTAVEDPDNLALKPRVERLERALLREALARSTGNQTKAAETLGLSRFGLQKKLRRYGIA